jgi:hypothetical protein
MLDPEKVSHQAILRKWPPASSRASMWRPLRFVLGSQALESTIAALRKRIEGFEAQAELAKSTDIPPGK